MENIGQWVNAWSSNIKWVIKAFSVVKPKKRTKNDTSFLSSDKYYVPAVAVIHKEQAFFRFIGRKELVGCL